MPKTITVKIEPPMRVSMSNGTALVYEVLGEGQVRIIDILHDAKVTLHA